ncbi:MAG: AMP-binding protein, partial [Cellulomonadaceae bacterium]|nr:AMP-binding protein [Cellulomonadaceae bacterium]
MTTASQPNRVDITPATSINSMLQDRVKRTGDGPMLERRETLDGPWLTVSAVTFDRHVTALARGFIARGVNVGDRVAIMSRTRYEWTVVDYALWAVGAVPVPIYETSAADQVEYILSDAEARLVVVEQAGHAQTVAEVRERLPHLEDVIVIDDGGLLALRDAGKDVDESAVVTRRDAVRSDDLATIIYTSGSTGRPKGAELTHGNFAHICLNARIVLPEVIEVPGSRTLLFLPIAHVFARLIQVAVLSSGSGVLGHAPDVKNLVADLGSFKPSFLLAVPRVFEKVYNSAQQKAAGSNLKRTIFHYAVR